MGRKEETRTNILPGASSFVGRADELGQIARRFDQARLVTLLAPGGMGKSRLAQQFGELCLATYGAAGGVWWIDLGEVASEEGLVAAIAAQVWGVSLGRSGEAIADSGRSTRQLGEELDRLGPCLLILDNFEQCVASSASVLQELIQMSPASRFLVTSRAALRLPSEQVLPLEPLSLEAAAELFCARAQAVDPRTVLDGDEVRLVVEAIDRMPLAIELAASRVRVLSLAQLRERLARPLSVLARDGQPSRHSSMRRAVEDSLALLTDSRRRCFVLASILRNGFRAEDAESILAGHALPRAEILDALDEFTRVSLLRSERSEEGARLGFFATIREVAAELAALDGAREAVVRKHASYFAGRAEAWERDVADGDIENLLMAHGTCHRLAGEGSVEWASRACAIAHALEVPLTRMGRLPTKLEIFEANAQHLTLLPTEGQASTLLGRGRARREAGRTADARADFVEAQRLSEELPWLSASALLEIASVDDVLGETEGTRRRCAEVVRLLEPVEGERRLPLLAAAYCALGHAHRREGALDEAKRSISAAVGFARMAGDAEVLAAALYELGAVEMFAGRAGDALACFDEGLEVSRASGLRVMEGAMTTARGCLQQDRGEIEKALVSHAAAARIFCDCGSRHREGSALYYLATTFLERGEPLEALPVLERARRSLVTVGAPRYDALVSSAMGLAHAHLGDAGRADVELLRADVALTQVPNEPALEASIAIRRMCIRSLRGDEVLPDEARVLASKHGSDDTRFALRMLEHALTGWSEHEEAPALRVWPGGAAFALPGADTVRLPEGSPLRAILECLVAARIESPGKRVLLEELIIAGWPGETMGAESALNRAYVALTTLRKKGLRMVIERVAGGYALSAGVALRRVNTE